MFALRQPKSLGGFVDFLSAIVLAKSILCRLFQINAMFVAICCTRIVDVSEYCN